MGVYTHTHAEMMAANYKELARWHTHDHERLTFWAKDKHSGVEAVTFAGCTNMWEITQADLDLLSEFFAGYDADSLQRFDYEIQYEYRDYFKDNALQVPQGEEYKYVQYRTERIFEKSRELHKPEIDSAALTALLCGNNI